MLPSYRTPSLATSLCLLLAIAGQANAQFTTVLNIPDPDANIGYLQAIDSNTQLNLSEGGAVGEYFNAGNSNGTSTNVEVNIIGGGVGPNFKANSGSTVNLSEGYVDVLFRANSGSEINISGGFVNHFFEANSGSEVNISGGILSYSFEANPGSNVDLTGGNYRLNGVEYTSDSITLTDNDVFTGQLADGTPFIFSPQTNDALNGATLNRTTLPAIDLTPVVMNVKAPIDGLFNLGPGQTLTIQERARLRPGFVSLDATLNIKEGAILREFAKIAGGTLNISGGNVERNLNVFSGSEVNISGGSIDRDFTANSDSKINISGGFVGSYFTVNSGSEFNTVQVVIATGKINITSCEGSEVMA